MSNTTYEYPEISIIVPVYNVEKYIHRCIASILAQTYSSFECILVDDCSSDTSGQICEEYAKKDERIKVIHKAQNGGLPQARKTGVENSSGEYVQFVDSDDWIEPNMIELLYKEAVSGNFDMVVCDYFVYRKDSVTIKNQRDYYNYEKHDIIKHFMTSNIHGNVWNKFVHKRLLLLVDFPIYNYLEDCVISIQNLYNASKIGLINVPLYHYCYNPQSIINNKNKKAKTRKKFEGSENWYAILRFLSTKYGTQLKMLEPELSPLINKMKRQAFFVGDLKKIRKIHAIYPTAGFCSSLFVYLIKAGIKLISRISIFFFVIKVLKRLGMNFRKAKYFGIKIAFLDILNSLCLKANVFTNRTNEKKHVSVLAWLSKNYDHLIQKYKNQYKIAKLNSSVIPKQIWIMWWDGIGAMPPLVKACYNSVLRHANDWKVTVITKKNYMDFLSLSRHVVEKFEAGRISVTHLSDVIRMSLLGRYGGLWLDATVLVTSNVALDNMSFFAVRRDYGGKFVPKQRWSINCIAGSSEILLFHFLSDFFCEYLKDHSEMIDYFLLDYAIALAYNSIPEVKGLIDNIIPNNKNYMLFNRHLQDEYSPQFFDDITKDTAFHKLTWKKKYPPINSQGKITLYGFILQQNQESISAQRPKPN